MYIVWVFKKVTFLAEGSEKLGSERKINPTPTHSPPKKGAPPKLQTSIYAYTLHTYPNPKNCPTLTLSDTTCIMFI